MTKLLGIILAVLALRFLGKGAPAPAGAPVPAPGTVASPSGGYKSATIPGQGDLIAAATGALSTIGGIVGSSGFTSSGATLTFVPGAGDFVAPPGIDIFGVVHFYKPPPDGCQGEVPVQAPPADWNNPPIGNFYDEENLTLVKVISAQGTENPGPGFPCARLLKISAGSFVNPFVPGLPPIPTVIVRYTF